ncbi:unnamed protein product [Gongylonema pulchrum]|uniref:Uncharacterized protein n=1 Tax=Gongylonema pulchrum TaxID=637853 RepID=A0A183DBS3_9BILA|nr:unnamed protein product [Gongylonema pulchrum]
MDYSGRGGNASQQGFISRIRQGTKRRKGSNFTSHSEGLLDRAGAGDSEAAGALNILTRGNSIIRTLTVPRHGDDVR